MKSEIIRIICAGLDGDKKKVREYAKFLSSNIVESDPLFSKQIDNVLTGKLGRAVVLDKQRQDMGL